MSLRHALVFTWAAAVACASPTDPAASRSLAESGRPPCTPNPDTMGVEACNGIDDDCNGDVDDAPNGGPLRRACDTACGKGVEECAGGAWAYCTSAPSEEECNGIDDNCDGQIDEGCACRHGETRPCGEAIGACKQGLEECAYGKWLGVCHGLVGPKPEVCGNGIDDDCNGAADDNCACSPNQTETCGVDVGACKKGAQICTGEGKWGTCDGAIAPVMEICNGIDDDCDGQVDWNVALGSGWKADVREPMGSTCDDAIALPNAFEDSAWIKVPVADPNDTMTYPSIYPLGDADWYRFTAVEGGNGICAPGTSQCAFVLTVELQLKDAGDRHAYDFCVALASSCGDIGSTNKVCATDSDWSESKSAYQIALKWAGTCAIDDSKDAIVMVANKPSAMTCGFYQLSAGFVLDLNEACP